MRRSEFMARLASFGLLGAALTHGDDGYRPCGHLTTDMPYAPHVDFVTLDGERVEHVVELHDVEGWLVRYVKLRNDEFDITECGIRTEYLRGTVRVHWRAT